MRFFEKHPTWWFPLAIFANLALVGGITYAIIHFVRRNW